MMKKLIYIIIPLLLMGSCDLLELEPIDNYSIENYWTSESQIDRFMYGLHNRIRTQKHDFIQLGELRGGYLKPGPQSTVGQGMSDLAIVSHSLSVENPGKTAFGDFYMDIMQINYAISSINTLVDFLDDSDKNYYLGMLHGMRAFYYFHLFRSWGGMPIVETAEVLEGVTDVSELNKARSTERETYAFVREDVLKSLSYFADDNFADKYSSPAAYWSKQASYMLMAEVYMWGAKVTPIGEDAVYSDNPTADLEAARDLLLEIEGKTSLVADMETLYQVKDNSEMIYGIRYALNEASNSFSSFLYPQATFTNWYNEDGTAIGADPLTAYGGSQTYEYTIDLYDTLDDADIRKDYNFMFFGREVVEGRPPVVIESIRAVCMTKYLGNTFSDESQTLRQYVDDYPIYRKADLLLMLAEIYNELDDAGNNVKRCIEEVRTRAFGGILPTEQEFTYTDKTTTEELILLERDKEFICEGKRWYDIRRMLDAKYALALCGDDARMMLWPISSGDLADDPLLEQNPGY